MNHRRYKLVNSYLSEVLFDGLTKMDCKFVGKIMCWKSKDNIVIMIEDDFIKITSTIWYELTNHFGLTVPEIELVIIKWIKDNLGIDRKLTMADCSYKREYYLYLS